MSRLPRIFPRRHVPPHGSGRGLPRMARQRGMAVIAALVVVAAAAVVTAAIVERQSLLADTLAGERDRVQAKWLLRGGLDWSRVILFNDARHNAVTRKNAIWDQPISALEIIAPGDARKAYFSGQIEDEQGKFNLTGLAVRGVVQPAQVAALKKLLGSLGVPDGLAGPIAQRVADSQLRPDGGQAAPGLRSVGDLLGIEGISPAMAATLSSYLAVLPKSATINANTASAEVLSASIPGLDLARARDLTVQRDGGRWFTSRADFFNRLNDPDIVPGNQIGIASDWFKVTGQVALDDVVARMQALLYRHGGQPPAIRWIKE